MAQADKAPRQNRTLTVDFHDEATYFQLLDDTKALAAPTKSEAEWATNGTHKSVVLDAS